MEFVEPSSDFESKSSSGIHPVEGRRQDRHGHSNRVRSPRAYRFCDGATEALLYFMLIFSPWAFGTTREWAIWVMNSGGYLLGGLWLAKGLIRRMTGYQPARWGDLEIPNQQEAETRGRISPGEQPLTSQPQRITKVTPTALNQVEGLVAVKAVQVQVLSPAP